MQPCFGWKGQLWGAVGELAVTQCGDEDSRRDGGRAGGWIVVAFVVKCIFSLSGPFSLQKMGTSNFPPHTPPQSFVNIIVPK